MNYKINKYQHFNQIGQFNKPFFRIEKDYGFLNYFFDFELRIIGPESEKLKFNSIEDAERYIDNLKNNIPVNCLVKTVVKTI